MGALKRALLLTAGWASLAALGGAASAQTAAPSDGQTAQRGIAVEEIVVTARKRAESLQDIPLSISAFSSDQIERRGLKDLADVSRFTPGFSFEVSGGRSSNSPRFRGMNADTNRPDRQIASTFIDGAYFAGSIAALGFEDVERIEVLKGPQSAFFGRATFGGAISITTKAPSDEWEGRASATLAEHGEKELTAGVSGPIVGDILTFRASARYFDFKGEHINRYNGKKYGDQNTKTGSLTIQFKPVDNFTAKARVLYTKDTDGQPATGFYSRGDHNAFGLGGAIGSYFVGEVKDRPSGLNVEIFPGNLWGVTKMGLNRDLWVGNLDIDWDVADGWTISTLTNWSEQQSRSVNDGDGTDFFLLNPPNITVAQRNALNAQCNTWPRPGIAAPIGPQDACGFGWTAFNDLNVRDIAQEARLSTPQDWRLRGLVGVYYLEQKITFKGPFGRNGLRWGLQPPTPPVNQGSDFKKTITNKAVFAGLTFDVTEALEVSAEGRYQEEKAAQIPIGTGSTTEFVKKFDKFLPRVIAKYDISDDANIYVQWAKGNRGGDFNQSVIAPTTPRDRIELLALGVPEAVPEEEIENYEAGLKSSWFDNRATFNISGYIMKWKNQGTRGQVLIDRDGNPANGREQPINIVIPAGSSDLWGIEAESQLVVSENLSLSGTFAWTPSEITVCNNQFYEAVFGTPNCAGKRTARNPKWAYSIGANWTDDLVGDWQYSINADWSWTGKHWEDVHNLAYYGEGGRMNLRVGVNNEMYRITVFARNLFDDKTVRSASRFTDLVSGGNFYGVQFNRPSGRQIGVTVAANF